MKLHDNTQKTIAGFSLVEVTLAIGIASLGLLAILGLMPQGLEMSRKTGQIVSERHLVEQVVRNLEQTSWDRLVDSTVTKYYDDQGVEVESANDFERTYTAQVEVDGDDVRFPGSRNDELMVKKVVIKVTNSLQNSFSFDDQNSRNYRTFVQYIAKGK